MENKTINLKVVAKVAKALKELNDNVVFVGGAVVSLYTDDPASEEIRPTQDVDISLDILNLKEWERLEQRLAELEFYPDPFGSSICRYKYEDIPVDIMSMQDTARGESNRWYKVRFTNSTKVKVEDQEIKILSAPCYIATKFEAFKNRGNDYRTSHDIEDIIYIIDNRITIAEEVTECKKEIKEFIKTELNKMESQGLLEEVLTANIHPLIQEQRMPLIMDKIRTILNS